MPYLHAEPHRIDYWRRKLGTANGLRVGLVWAGSSREHNPQARAIDRRRSLSLSELAPLAAVGGIELFSLQKGAPAAQAAEPPAGMKLVDHTGAINDFSDTAALIANLDLVVSVDTSVAHLAGALGKPVWILSRFDGCWRWLLEREDSPWYPTARLFRQRQAGNWEPVIERVADALAALARRAG